MRSGAADPRVRPAPQIGVDRDFLLSGAFGVVEAGSPIALVETLTRLDAMSVGSGLCAGWSSRSTPLGAS
jgi:hypothetical protein